MTCPNGSSYQEVSGHFAVLTVCAVRSDHFHTFPEKYHEGFTSNLSSHIFPINTLNYINFKNISIKYVTNTLSEFSFTNISDFEDAVHESLPMYLSPYVHFPTVIVPVLIFCIVFVTLYFCVKRATSLYNELKTRLQRPSEEIGETRF